MTVSATALTLDSGPLSIAPLISWPGGSPENTGIVVGVILGAYVIALWLTAVIWTARDIRSRSHDPVSQFVAVSMVMALNLPGWVLYRVLRPPLTLAELYERQLEEETLLRDLGHELACPTCSAPVEEAYVACPHCATGLKDACESCGKALSFAWRACPWCASERGSVRAPVAPSSGGRAVESVDAGYAPRAPRPIAALSEAGDATPFGKPEPEGPEGPWTPPGPAQPRGVDTASG